MDEKIIIEEVRYGNSDNFNIILANYRMMIYKIINNYSLRYGDYIISEEDLFQEASVGLYDACLKYDSSKNVKFSTFAYIVIKRRIQRVYKMYRETYGNENISLDNVDAYEYINYSSYINEINYHYGSRELIDNIKEYYEKLNKIDRKIIDLRIQKYSYKEIAERLNISRKVVDNKIYRIRKLLEKYIDNKNELDKRMNIIKQ